MAGGYEYELTVIRREANPEWKPGPYVYGQPESQMQQFINERMVTAVINEDEYEAVKRALLEHWAK